MIYSTIVEKDESALKKIIEALDRFEKDRFIAGIQVGNFSMYDIEQELNMVQMYQARMNYESKALTKFSETFISQFATDNNKCFKTAESYFKKIRSTLAALKQVFHKTCQTSRKQLPAGKENPSVFDRSALSNNACQLDLYGLESYDDKVNELYDRLDTLLSTATQTLSTCQRVIAQEELVRGDAEMLRSIYADSCKNLLFSVQDCSKLLRISKTISENELMRRKEKARSKDEFLKSEYHNVNTSEFKEYVWLVKVKEGRCDGLTDEETYLWQDNHQKVAEVKEVLSLLDQLDQNEGQDGKFNGQFLVEFIKWCGVEPKKEKRLYSYLRNNYHGRYKMLAWTTVSQARKDMRDANKVEDSELVDSFNKRLKSLQEKMAGVMTLNANSMNNEQFLA